MASQEQKDLINELEWSIIDAVAHSEYHRHELLVDKPGATQQHSEFLKHELCEAHTALSKALNDIIGTPVITREDIRERYKYWK